MSKPNEMEMEMEQEKEIGSIV
jgi:uncharacterized protein YbaA (DUF1428 family)